MAAVLPVVLFQSAVLQLLVVSWVIVDQDLSFVRCIVVVFALSALIDSFSLDYACVPCFYVPR